MDYLQLILIIINKNQSLITSITTVSHSDQLLFFYLTIIYNYIYTVSTYTVYLAVSFVFIYMAVYFLPCLS